MVYLEARIGNRVERFPLEEGAWLVGRSDQCDLVLADETVSRQHFQLTVTAESADVEDLGSRHGVWIEGHRVQFAEVQPGRWFFAGRVALLLCRAPAEPDPESRTRAESTLGA